MMTPIQVYDEIHIVKDQIDTNFKYMMNQLVTLIPLVITERRGIQILQIQL